MARVSKDRRTVQEYGLFPDEFYRSRIEYSDTRGGETVVEVFGLPEDGHITWHKRTDTINLHGICKKLTEKQARALVDRSAIE